MFFDAYVSGDRGLTLDCGSRIEGIGRPRVEASFLPEVIDAMVKVPDAWSLAAMHYLARRLGRRVGGSSGTNLIGALVAARQMVAAGEKGSLVAILCDGGERYATTYYDPVWLARRAMRWNPGRGAGCLHRAGRGVARRAAGGWTLKEWICTVCELPKPAISRP